MPVTRTDGSSRSERGCRQKAELSSDSRKPTVVRPEFGRGMDDNERGDKVGIDQAAVSYTHLFGGVLNAFELTKAMIEAGAAGVHFEDQLSSAKKCGHMGGKVLVPTREAVQKLVAARLAADVLDVPTIIVARTDADAAQLITSDCDPVDRPFLSEERTVEGFHRFHGGLEAAIARGLAYAPWADMVWCETSEPNVGDARRFAEAILEKFPGKLLAYNCSPSFHWEGKRCV